MTDWIELGLKENGFFGYFKEGTKHHEKAMICMSGADGSKEFALLSGQEIWNMGYSVLVLGFIKWEGLPKEICLIPVEYVENAVEWLRSKEGGKIKKIGIQGASTGAQYAFLCASLCPEISCVIAASPFDYVMEFVDGKFRRTGKSTYMYQGEEIAFSPAVLLDKSIPGLLWKCATDKHYGLKRMLRFYYDNNPLTEEGRIRVENMKADVLLLASENDDCWPSEVSVRRVDAILRNVEYPYRVKSVIYEKGSHAIGGMLNDEKMRKRMKKILPAEKKYPAECEEARVDSMKQIEAFLAEW